MARITSGCQMSLYGLDLDPYISLCFAKFCLTQSEACTANPMHNAPRSIMSVEDTELCNMRFVTFANASKSGKASAEGWVKDHYMPAEEGLGRRACNIQQPMRLSIRSRGATPVTGFLQQQQQHVRFRTRPSA